jgi:two-component system response regulator FlrC
MQRALVLCDGDLVRDSHIIFEPPAAAPLAGPQVLAAAATALPAVPASGSAPEAAPGALAESLALAEQRIILEALRSNETRERIAERLGISPRTLRYKLARLRRAGIDCDELAVVGGSSS